MTGARIAELIGGWIRAIAGLIGVVLATILALGAIVVLGAIALKIVRWAFA
jgi:hypothetical protein